MKNIRWPDKPIGRIIRGHHYPREIVSGSKAGMPQEASVLLPLDINFEMASNHNSVSFSIRVHFLHLLSNNIKVPMKLNLASIVLGH